MKTKKFYLYSFLVGSDGVNYLNVIATDMRAVRKACPEHAAYLPGGRLYSVSDASRTEVRNGTVLYL